MKIKSIHLITLLLVIYLPGIYPVNAKEVQEADTENFRKALAMSFEDLLNMKIETSSKIPRASTDVTQRVDIITREQIAEIISGNRNISEYLQYLPGASIRVLSRNDANWGSYGGIGPKYNTYMINGIPVDSFIDPQSIDEMAIQRIEVQRGPASVLYPNYLSQDFAGNQSPLAGTVNLILKKHIENPETMISLDYGTYNTYGVKAYHQNHYGKLHFWGGISYESSDYTNYGSAGSWLNMLDDPEYRKTKLYIGTSIFLDKSERHEIIFFGNHTNHKGDWGRVFRQYHFKYDLINIRYNGHLNENLQLTLKTGFRWYDREYQGDQYDSLSGVYILDETTDIEQQIIPVDLSLNLNHFNNSNFTIGADYQNASYLTKLVPVNQIAEAGNDALATQAGVYTQEELQLNRFTLRGGLRFNNIEYDIKQIGGESPGAKKESWEKIIWSTGIKYRINNEFTLFTNAGNSFMSPGLKSIGGTLPLSERGVPGSNGQLPNPGLEPEKGISVDFGSDYLFSHGIHLSTRFFYTELSDAIIDIVVSQNPSQTMSVNAKGKTTGKGFELGFNQYIKNKVNWFMNLTYIDSEIDDPDDSDQDGSEVPFVPQTMFNLGATLYLPMEITISPMLHYSGHIYDSTFKNTRSSFSTKEQVNISISKELNTNSIGRNILSLNVYNITNNKYEMPWQFRDTGTNFTIVFKHIF
ncbi:MAG: TonB-dependent receptor [Desulfobacteraceae bacterium]